jgi:hypothetical protein
VVSDGAALGKEELAAPYIETITRTHSEVLPVERAMPLWDTVMIALAFRSTILFCFWASIRATGGDG